MPVDVIIGAQWGDEGKAKVIDFISQKADYVVRYQGGANAGHTVVIEGKQIIFHLLPSGLLHKGVKGILGSGMVIDLEQLIKEIRELQQLGYSPKENIFISHKAHIVMPYHKRFDALYEELKGKKIGTTARGIGPTYGDKYIRNGIRIEDLLNPSRLKEKLRFNIEFVNELMKFVFKKDERYDVETLYDETMKYGEEILDRIEDIEYLLYKELKSNKKVIFEGAQGTLLDIDHGTYPYVTSSNPTIGGVFTGSGINHSWIENVIGITKAYTTRVGGGPFPTEETGDIGQQIRDIGKEYGATTGRPRRCGWLDLVALKYAVMINGINNLVITKLDVLSHFDIIKVCTEYEVDGEKTDRFISYKLEYAKPVYKEFEGWKEDISGCRSFDQLPKNAKSFINFIKEYLGIDIYLISVGPDREQSICLK